MSDVPVKAQRREKIHVQSGQQELSFRWLAAVSLHSCHPDRSRWIARGNQLRQWDPDVQMLTLFILARQTIYFLFIATNGSPKLYGHLYKTAILFVGFLSQTEIVGATELAACFHFVFRGSLFTSIHRTKQKPCVNHKFEFYLFGVLFPLLWR